MPISLTKTIYSYEGLDMSPSQFPSQPSQNITFSVLNILDPVPEDKQGTFDVLHLRLLVLGLPKGQWGRACKNLLQLLKPGGWLQWEEAEFAYVNRGSQPTTCHLASLTHRTHTAL